MEENILTNISANDFYKIVDLSLLSETIQFIKGNNISLKQSTIYSLIYNNEPYPPKDVLRYMAQLKGYKIDEKTLTGGKANKPFEDLGLSIIKNDEYPFINLSKFNPQIRKYNEAIEKTNWLKEWEIYKFNFVNWINENIDFKNETDDIIKRKIDNSQEIKFDPNTNIKGINFLTSIKRFNDEFITLNDIGVLKSIANNEKEYNEYVGSFSFNSYPKASLYLSLFNPTKFCPYDGESIPSFDFLKSDNINAPKKGYKAFVFYQIYYQNIKNILKNSHLNIDKIKEIIGINNLTELHWNFITQDFLLFIARNIMTTNTLQKKYNEFIEKNDLENWDWYKSIKKFSEAIIEIKIKISKNQIHNYSELNSEFRRIVNNPNEDFLNRYLYISDNGFSTIKQQLIKIEDRKTISEKVINDFTQLKNILLITNKDQCLELINKLINGNNWSVIYRFLRALFPNDFTAVDAPNQFDSLLGKLYNEFGIELEKLTQIDRNNELLNLIEFDDIYKAQIFFWMYRETDEQTENTTNKNQMKTPLNQILFGAPGTGKTYSTKKIAVEIITDKKFNDTEEDRKEIIKLYDEYSEKNQIRFTTFHQSLSYEDFIEGIKPKTIDNKVIYDVKDGIFKTICREATQLKESNNFNEAYNKFIEEITEQGSIELNSLVQNKPFNVKINSNQNCVAIPKTEIGTNMVITKKMIEEYVINNNVLDWKTYTSTIGEYIKSKYNVEVINSENQNKKYVLIIDEINRGNVSSIFGELITLLEEDKRKGNDEKTEVILPYSQKKFSVPNNVYIIGTMNTADRSVESLDTALRRRFSFVEMPSQPKLLENKKLEDAEIYLTQMLTTINDRIELLIDKDHQIGHSFFININNLEELKSTFKNKIIPLLEEYFFGDFGKIGLVLGEAFINEKNGSKVKLANFASYDDTSFLTEKKVYQIKNCDELKAQDFISIYE